MANRLRTKVSNSRGAVYHWMQVFKSAACKVFDELLKRGGAKGRPGTSTSSGNRGGEDLIKAARTPWRIALGLNNPYAISLFQ